MAHIKRLLARPAVRAAVCWAGAGYIRWVHGSGRWETLRAEIPARFWDAHRPFILAFWHGRLLMMPYAWRPGVPMRMLISRHRDGELIARTIARFGLGTVRGSTRAGAADALRGMVRTLRDGTCVGVTPDGPRGPRMRAQPGIVQLARLSGVPIVPASFSASRAHMLSSWDRFMLALPFSRGVFVWGEPVSVARDADEAGIERARDAVEQALNALTAEADRALGRVPVAPAEQGPEAGAPGGRRRRAAG